MGCEHVTQPIRGRCCLPGSAIGFVGLMKRRRPATLTANANQASRLEKHVVKTANMQLLIWVTKVD